MIALWWALVARAEAPLEISVGDPLVNTVILHCGAKTMQSPVKAGVAAFDSVPNGCTVELVRAVKATIDAPGKWSCSLDGCAQDDVDHAPVSNASHRVNIVMTAPLPDGASLEVSCPGDVYRERREPVQNTAVFDSVPEENCTLLFKGTTPARYAPLKFGTYYCSITGATAVCTLK